MGRISDLLYALHRGSAGERGFKMVLLASIVFMMVIIIKTLIWGDPVAGFPTLATLLLFTAGVQLLFSGIIGQYLAKNYIETKDRPMYIVKEMLDSKEK
jgi:glycosyltransferase involved in cell wall biosynthesis